MYVLTNRKTFQIFSTLSKDSYHFSIINLLGSRTSRNNANIYHTVQNFWKEVSGKRMKLNRPFLGQNFIFFFRAEFFSSLGLQNLYFQNQERINEWVNLVNQ